MNASGARDGRSVFATQSASDRGGGEVGSGKNEACDNSGAAAKLCEGVSCCKSGMKGNISETARWQSTQCVQPPDGAGSAGASALWQGMVETREGASFWAVAMDAPVFPTKAETGMTAAMAPDAGSHTIIQANISLRRSFITIGQA